MLELLLYVYIAIFPLSQRIFNLLGEISVGSFHMGVGDAFYLLVFLVITLWAVRTPKLRVNYNYSITSLLRFLILGYMAARVYPFIVDLLILGKDYVEVMPFMVKNIMLFIPLYIISQKGFVLLRKKYLLASLLVSSLILMLSAIFNDFFAQALSFDLVIAESGDIRVRGLFGFGDGNSQAIYSVFVFAVLASNLELSQDSFWMAVVGFISAFVNTSLVASRGAFVSLILVVALIRWFRVKTTKKSILYTVLFLVAIVVATYFMREQLELVVFRMFESGTTQRDFDPSGDTGRLVSLLEGVQYVINRPRVLFWGDYFGNTFNLYGQTSHNWWVKAVLNAGIVGLLWVTVSFSWAFFRLRKSNLKILMTFMVASFSYPDYHLFILISLYFIYVLVSSNEKSNGSHVSRSVNS